MSKRTCSIQDCERQLYARTWCRSHYRHWQRHGDPLDSPRKHYSTPSEALTARTHRTDSCWIWTGAVDERGYGSIRVEGRSRRVHRYAWEQVNGPIPEGMEVDHACWNPSCVRVDHLRLASRAENNRNISGARRDNKSTGVRNVYPNGRGYMVQIRKEGKFHHGGTHETVEEAARIAARMRAELFGEFAGRPHALAEVGHTEKEQNR